MPRRLRARIVLSCLLVLCWCQLAAAAQLCGVEGGGAGPPPCHVDDGAGPDDAPRCDACVDQLGTPTPDLAPPMAPLREAFGPLAAAVSPVAPVTFNAPPPRPPPYLSGRLLI